MAGPGLPDAPYLAIPHTSSRCSCKAPGTASLCRFRFWINNQSRMYLLEGTKPIQRLYQLGVGDVIQFAKLPDGKLVACGRRGTE